jgi:hypothetical protein
MVGLPMINIGTTIHRYIPRCGSDLSVGLVQKF